MTMTPAQSAETLADLLAFAATRPDVVGSEACDEPPEPDYCQHRARVCECDRAADIYYGDIR